MVETIHNDDTLSNNKKEIVQSIDIKEIEKDINKNAQLIDYNNKKEEMDKIGLEDNLEKALNSIDMTGIEPSRIETEIHEKMEGKYEHNIQLNNNNESNSNTENHAKQRNVSISIGRKTGKWTETEPGGESIPEVPSQQEIDQYKEMGSGGETTPESDSTSTLDEEYKDRGTTPGVPSQQEIDQWKEERHGYSHSAPGTDNNEHEPYGYGAN